MPKITKVSVFLDKADGTVVLLHGQDDEGRSCGALYRGVDHGDIKDLCTASVAGWSKGDRSLLSTSKDSRDALVSLGLWPIKSKEVK